MEKECLEVKEEGEVVPEDVVNESEEDLQVSQQQQQFVTNVSSIEENVKTTTSEEVSVPI